MVTGRQTQLPMDKGLKPMRVSLYIHDGEHKFVLVLSNSKWRMTATRFNDAGTHRYSRPINVSVNFQCFLRLIEFILWFVLKLCFNFKALPNVTSNL